MGMVGEAIGGIQKKAKRDKYLEELPSKMEGFGATPEESKFITSLESEQPGTASKYMLEMIQNRAKEKAKEGVASPITASDARARGIPEPEIPTFLKLGVKDQLDYIARVQSKGEAERRDRGVINAQTKDFGTRALKISDAETETMGNLNAIEKFAAQGTVPSEAGAAMYIGKLMQGGGVLTEADVRPFAQKYGGGTIEAAMNYLTGKASGKMSEDHKAALKDIVNVLKEKMTSKALEQKANLLSEADLIAPDAKESVSKWAKKHNFVQENGAWVHKKPADKSQQLTGDYASLLQAVDKTPDTKRSAAARAADKEKIIQYAKSGTPIPQKVKELYGIK